VAYKEKGKVKRCRTHCKRKSFSIFSRLMHLEGKKKRFISLKNLK